MRAFFSLIVRCALCCGYASCVAVRCLGQDPASGPVKVSEVHIRVNTEYDDSDESLRLLETLARYAPVRQVTVAPGDTLAALFVREYGFGVGDLPKSYASIV